MVCEGFQPHHKPHHDHHQSLDSNHTKLTAFPQHGHQTKDHHTKVAGSQLHGHQTKDMLAATKVDNWVMRKEKKTAAGRGKDHQMRARAREDRGKSRSGQSHAQMARPATPIRKVPRREKSTVDLKVSSLGEVEEVAGVKAKYDCAATATVPHSVSPGEWFEVTVRVHTCNQKLRAWTLTWT